MKTVKWGTVGIALGITAVLGTGGVFALNSSGVLDQPTKPVTSVVDEQPASTPTATPTFTPTATPTPEPIEEAPVVVEEAPEPPYYGEPVPWIADPNPNNAEGGYWDTTACASGAAYQAEDGNQYCR